MGNNLVKRSEVHKQTSPEMKQVFTRYLYFVDDVYNSLVWSILDKQREESLFWIYELYFSGFQEDAFKVLNDVYYKYFAEKNPHIGEYLNKLVIEWDDVKNKHNIIGTIISVLVTCEISLTSIVRNIDNGAVVENIEIISLPREIADADITKFYTINSSQEVRPYRILQIACKYPIRGVTCEYLGLFGVNDKKKYSQNWLYYANNTPFWRERILEFNGNVDETFKIIVFDTLENEESFYNTYDLEPEEQTSRVLDNLWLKSYVSMSWSDFYVKYGSKSVYRQLKIHKKKI
jgi:hypothetical protein